MKIQYTKHSGIDFTKWDDCIRNSLNGIVYAYSWYLNIVAGEWDAIVCDDYSIVFPLVKNRKFGISYIYQPFFTQQLGAFSATKVDMQTLELIIDSIPQRFKYKDISLNLYNRLDSSKFSLKNRVTYQLDLVQPYFTLSSGYNENTRRNISKAVAMGVKVDKRLPVDEFIEFYKRNLAVALAAKEFVKLRKVVQLSIDRKEGEIYASYTAQGLLCAAAFL